MRRSRRLLAVAALVFGAAAAFADAPPERVVSMNLCTDQYAMLVAGPGQLLSVSALAADPRESAMAESAQALHLNHGRAEEIFLLKPDLVLAGTYTARASVEMLRRLGIEVVTLDVPSSLADVEAQIRQIGALLGQQARATAVADDFAARLEALRAAAPDGPRAAIYGANGYTTGRFTLSGDILDAAGFANVATEAGLTHGGEVSLERLVLLAPDLVMTGRPYPGASRAEEILSHPALEALGAVRVVRDARWSCGTPVVLEAIADLQAQARHGEGG